MNDMRWNKLDRPLILASQSPRRKELLKNMGFTFSIQPPTIVNEEAFICIDTIVASMQGLAYAKAQSVGIQHAPSLVLGGDTVVVIDNEVIGKPADREDAKRMLKRLSGNMHKVYTGVALLCADINFRKTASACTDVFFRNIPEWEINEYLTYDEYADKAGAYAIQGKAMNFVEKLNGCFYNVMGLPISVTIELYTAYTEFLKGLQ